MGPCGNPWPLVEGARRACVVAGGVGVTPVVACARMLAAAGVALDAVVGAQTAGRLWGTDVLRGLGADEVVVTTDDGTAGRAGFTTDALAELLAANAYDVVYACGPEPMMAGVARICPRGRRRVPRLHGADDELRLWRVRHLQRGHGRRHLQVLLQGRPGL